MADQPSLSAPAGAERRAFATISHPDAGKATLTEKLLLYGNAGDILDRMPSGTSGGELDQVVHGMIWGRRFSA